MAAEYLSTLDAALLSLETEAQQLNILAVLIIEPDPDIPPEDHYRVGAAIASRAACRWSRCSAAG